MIIGAHSIIYSKSPELDRAFLRDVLKLPNIDLGGGWLIFTSTAGGDWCEEQAEDACKTGD